MAAQGNTAVGDGALANGGAYSSAFGQKAVATGPSTTAIGYNASATPPNSVALGANSVASRPQSVSIGSPLGGDRWLTNVAPGFAPDDAVNYSQLLAVQKEERRGIAAVTAIPTMVPPSAPGKFTVAIGAGGFMGEAGVGITGTYRLPTVTPAYISASYSNGGGGNENTFKVQGAVEF